MGMLVGAFFAALLITRITGWISKKIVGEPKSIHVGAVAGAILCTLLYTLGSKDGGEASPHIITSVVYYWPMVALWYFIDIIRFRKRTSTVVKKAVNA